MTTPKETKKQIPKFHSLKEEAEFWETHSPLDYPEQWTEVKQVKVERPLGHILGVRLDAGTLDRLATVAQKKGIGPSTLARIWLMERLAEEEEAGQQRPARHSRTPVASR